MKTMCLECSNNFDFKGITQTIEGVDIVFAECPECGRRYLSFVVDKEVKKSLEKTQQIRRRMEDSKLSYSKRQKATRKLKKMTEENRRLMREKKAEYQHLIQQVLDHDE